MDINNNTELINATTQSYRKRLAEPRQIDECYEKDEVMLALRSLSAESIKKIQSFARFRLMGDTARLGQPEVEDLFIDAVIRTIERKRKWKRGVTIFAHFFGVMRSIAYQRLKQASRYTPLSEMMPGPQEWSLSTFAARTSIDRLRDALRGDAIALSVLDSMKDEMRPWKTQFSLSISAERYWAARKRISRMAEKLSGLSSPLKTCANGVGHH